MWILILFPSFGRSFNAFSEVFPGRGGIEDSIDYALNDVFLVLTGASALNWRIRPVSVGFWYHEVSIFPFNNRTSMSRKVIELSFRVSMVNSEFGCRLLLTSRMQSMLDTLALLSVVHVPSKDFRIGVLMGPGLSPDTHIATSSAMASFLSANVNPVLFLWNQDMQVEHCIA